MSSQDESIERLRRQVRRLTWWLVALTLTTVLLALQAIRTRSEIVLTEGGQKLTLAPTGIALSDGKSHFSVALVSEDPKNPTGSLRLSTGATEIDMLTTSFSADMQLQVLSPKDDKGALVHFLAMDGISQATVGDRRGEAWLHPEGVRTKKDKVVRRCVLEEAPEEEKSPPSP